MQGFLGLGTVATAIALVITVWAAKMGPTGGNWMLAVAWALFAVSIYASIPAVSQQQVVPRMLWTMLGAAVVGLVLHRSLWTSTEVTSGAVSVELVPFEMSYWYRPQNGKFPGQTLRGIGAVVRFKNLTDNPVPVRALEVSGDVTVGQRTYLFARLEEEEEGEISDETIEVRLQEWAIRRPFYQLSWVTWPDGSSTVGARDELILKFLLVPVAQVGLQARATRTLDGREVPTTDYFGSAGTNPPRRPRILTTVPSFLDLMEFGGVSPEGEGTLPRLRQEVVDQRVVFRIRLDGEAIDVQQANVAVLRSVTSSAWQSMSPQELFFSTGPLGRGIPVERDPLVP